MSNITKRALEDSLKHLLLKKPVNKITINDITEDCGVNRATFYYHFQDIYALFMRLRITNRLLSMYTAMSARNRSFSIFTGWSMVS